MRQRVQVMLTALVGVEVIASGVFARLASGPHCGRFVGKACTTCWHQHQHNLHLYLPLLYGTASVFMVTLAVYAYLWLQTRKLRAGRSVRPIHHLYFGLAVLWALLGIGNVVVDHMVAQRILVAAVTVVLVGATVLLAFKLRPTSGRAQPTKKQPKSRKRN